MFALYLLATLTNIAAGPRMQSEIVLNRLGRDQYMFLVQSTDLARTLRLAHRHLPPADFDLTKRITRTISARKPLNATAALGTIVHTRNGILRLDNPP
jgi:hypothetical protein